MALRAVLTRPAFRALFAGQVVSIAGDRFHYLALVALLTAHAAGHGEGRAFLLSALAWAMLAPSLVVSPWAGAVVDRLPLVRVLLVTDVLRALVVAVIPLAYTASGSPFAALALVAVAFTLNCFFLPARSALPPHLVPPAALSGANAVLVLGGVLATVLGSAAGGPVVDRFGPTVALYLDAATYGVSAIALWGILRAGVEAWPEPGAAAAAATGRIPVGAAIRGAARDALAGWVLLGRLPGARWPVAAGAATWVAGGVLHVAGTPHVQRGSTAVAGVGLMLAALAVGAALGTAWTLAREARARLDRRRALGVGLAGAGAGLAGFALADGLPAMALAGAVTGAFAAPVFFLGETALQEAVAPGTRGRLFAARDVVGRAAFLLTTALVAAPVAAGGGRAALLAAALFLVVAGAACGARGDQPTARLGA